MYAEPLLGEVAAPLDRDERIAAVKAALARHEFYPPRLSHAETKGLVITYAHVRVADGPRVAQWLVDALNWENSNVSNVSGMVGVATEVPIEGPAPN